MTSLYPRLEAMYWRNQLNVKEISPNLNRINNKFYTYYKKIFNQFLTLYEEYNKYKSRYENMSRDEIRYNENYMTYQYQHDPARAKFDDVDGIPLLVPVERRERWLNDMIKVLSDIHIKMKIYLIDYIELNNITIDLVTSEHFSPEDTRLLIEKMEKKYPTNLSGLSTMTNNEHMRLIVDNINELRKIISSNLKFRQFQTSNDVFLTNQGGMSFAFSPIEWKSINFKITYMIRILDKYRYHIINNWGPLSLRFIDPEPSNTEPSNTEPTEPVPVDKKLLFPYSSPYSSEWWIKEAHNIFDAAMMEKFFSKVRNLNNNQFQPYWRMLERIPEDNEELAEWREAAVKQLRVCGDLIEETINDPNMFSSITVKKQNNDEICGGAFVVTGVDVSGLHVNIDDYIVELDGNIIDDNVNERLMKYYLDSAHKNLKNSMEINIKLRRKSKESSTTGGKRKKRSRRKNKKSKKHHKMSKKQNKRSKTYRKRNNKKTHRKY